LVRLYRLLKQPVGLFCFLRLLLPKPSADHLLHLFAHRLASFDATRLELPLHVAINGELPEHLVCVESFALSFFHGAINAIGDNDVSRKIDGALKINSRLWRVNCMHRGLARGAETRNSESEGSRNGNLRACYRRRAPRNAAFARAGAGRGGGTRGEGKTGRGFATRSIEALIF
jgi:hypothetical protein